jgi:hypothetical protein
VLINNKGNSSVGRAAVSKTEGQGFKSLFSCFFLEKNYLPVLVKLIASFLFFENLQTIKKVAGVKL